MKRPPPLTVTRPRRVSASYSFTSCTARCARSSRNGGSSCRMAARSSGFGPLPATAFNGPVGSWTTVRRQVVHHHADPLGPREIDLGELPHAGGEMRRGAPLRDLDPAPGAMRVEDHEQVRSPVAAILVVVAPH